MTNRRMDLSSCFCVLSGLLFYPAFFQSACDAQVFTTSSYPYYYTSTMRPNSFNCGPSVFSSSKGNITSPNYPLFYSNNGYCNYFITTTALSTMNLNVEILGMETCCDYIQFVCQSNSVQRTLRFTGLGNRTYQISFKPCTRVLARFYSDGSENGRGFYVSYDVNPIRCQGNCTPIAIGAGYNCTCDENQTNPFDAPDYNKCPVGCQLDSTSSGYCLCSELYDSTTTQTSSGPNTPSVPTCRPGCYPYTDSFGYPLCYCNTTITTTSSTPSTTTTPLQCPYGCYLGEDNFGYKVCNCQGTTKATPCPFGCYNITYSWGFSYCECSPPQSTTPLTITCSFGCTPDRDYWGTPYCNCNTTSTPCNYPCYYGYDNNGYYRCICSGTSTTPSCNYPCYYGYDNNGYYRCICSGTSTTSSCNYPCYYGYDNNGYYRCICNGTTSAPPCYYPCSYGYDDYWNYRCICNYTSTAQTTSLQPMSDCGTTLTGDSGELTSPYYPTRSSSIVQCMQNITVDSANSIRLVFLDINLYYSTADNCQYEWIQIIGCDGSKRQICSPQLTNASIEFVCSQSYSVKIIFQPYYYGYYYGYRGYRLQYQAVFGSKCNSPEGLVGLGSIGNIVSPYYPGSYPILNDCFYLLQTTVEDAIQIRVAFEVLKMPTTCTRDYIKLYCVDGTNVTTICGSNIPSPKTFSCPSVEIKFHSETIGGPTPKLFKIVYYGISAPTKTSGASLTLRGRHAALLIGGQNLLILLLVAMATRSVALLFL